MVMHPRGGYRPGAGRKKGVPVKDPADLSQTHQMRIRLDLYQRAEQAAAVKGLKARQLIEELIEQNL
jgi:hypothetical protein